MGSSVMVKVKTSSTKLRSDGGNRCGANHCRSTPDYSGAAKVWLDNRYLLPTQPEAVWLRPDDCVPNYSDMHWNNW